MMTRTLKLTALVCLVCAATVLSGCGRKNLPVRPSTKDTPATEGSTSEPGTTSNQAATGTSSPVVPTTSLRALQQAPVARNPNSKRKTYPLDVLLN